MKKIYCIGIIIIIAIVALGLSIFYLSQSDDNIQETAAFKKNSGAENKASIVGNKANSVNVTPVDRTVPANVLTQQTKPIVIAEKKPDYIEDLRLAIEAGDEFAAQMALEAAAACETCIFEMITILDDPSYDKTLRKYIAGSLMKSGNPEGIVSVIKSIVAAEKEEDYDFKNELMQILSNSDSAETANALTEIVTGKSTFSSDLKEMPEDVIYAIKKAIRLSPDECVGEILAQKYVDASSEEEKKVLSEIKHPVMIARLAADAYEKKDNETADQLMEQLAGIEDRSAIKGIMGLAKESSVPLDTVANMISFWQIAQPDDTSTHDIFLEYLSNPKYSVKERSIAAYAIAHESNNDLAISALQKAQLYETDPTVKRCIEDALSKIPHNVNEANP